MKIRFYHWWVYKLYYKFWSPIFEEKPWMLKQMVKEQQGWLDQREEEFRERRKNFRVIE